ncbi:MAG: heavy metal-responsive transcriptional regulator, partial [Acidobacteria bacterium]|nr:heavy metal-responsive transcriptional regulator [Acidobacteriota bacterium]
MGETERMFIGEVARQTGVGIEALRFYEREGLIRPSGRLPSGYRIYGRGDVEAVRFIKRAQSLGFSLREIRELLVLRSQVENCSHVRDLLKKKLEAVEEKLKELKGIRSELGRALVQCERQLRRLHSRAECPVLVGIEIENPSAM